MTNFPTSLDTLTNPTANDTLAAVPHHTQHGTANDIIEALEAKVGIGASTPAVGKAFKSTGTGVSGWQHTGHVNVLDHGAVADGATDNAAAFTAAIAEAASLGAAVYIPSGVYRITSGGLLLPTTGDVDILGDGMFRTVIHYTESAASSGLLRDAGSLDATLARGNLTIRGVQFRGTWTTAQNGSGGAAVYVHSRPSVVIDSCRFYDLAAQAISYRLGNSLRVTGCQFEQIGSDCVFTRHIYNQTISGNWCKATDDDTFAIHQGDSELAATGMAAEGVVISDNVLEDACGIVALGARAISIHDNVLRRYKKTGITVRADTDAPFEESDAVQFSVRIHDNVLHDGLSRPSVAAAISYGILVSGVTPKGDTDSSSIVPGENNTGTGAIVRPFAYRENRYNTSGDATPPLWHVEVARNEVRRTLPAATNYSDWGYGEAFEASGFSDWNVQEADLKPQNGVSIQGDARYWGITDNIIEHTTTAIEVQTLTRHFGSDTSVISGNRLSDFHRGIYMAGAFSAHLAITDNWFNGDPYHDHSNRTTGGKFTANLGGPLAVSGTSTYGMSITGNRVKNVSNVFNVGSPVDIRGNLLYATANTLGGFHADNVGIGNIPTLGDGYVLLTTNGTPTSADYQKVTARTATQPVAASLFITAQDMWPSTTSGATAVATTETATNKQNIRYLTFPDGSTTYAEAAVGMPSDWDGGTFTATLYWTCTASAFFQTVWQVEARSYGDDESIDAAWGSAVTVTIAQGSSASQVQTGTSTAVTAAGTPAAGELLLLRFARLPGNASDNLAQNALLLGVRLNFTRTLTVL